VYNDVPPVVVAQWRVCFAQKLEFYQVNNHVAICGIELYNIKHKLIKTREHFVRLIQINATWRKNKCMKHMAYLLRDPVEERELDYEYGLIKHKNNMVDTKEPRCAHHKHQKSVDLAI